MRGGSFGAFPFFIVMEQEIWKDVKGWEGFYQVSNLGRVKSVDRFVKRGKKKMHVRELLLKNTLDSKGYYMVALCDKERGDIKKARVHRLVAEAFIQNPQNKPLIDHLDRNRQNNNINNLRWCTMSENMLNPLTRNFRRDMYIGIERPCIYKPVVAIKDGVVVKQYESIKSAIKDGFTECCISNCCSGRDKTHKGYSWMYLSDYENSCHQ
jgi:hypothetical protein